MKSVEEKCQILRPDLFATDYKQLLEEWVRISIFKSFFMYNKLLTLNYACNLSHI